MFAVIYRNYEHSMLATWISLLSRIFIIAAFFFACYLVSVSNIVLAVLCVVAIPVLFVGGNKWSESVGKKADIKFYEKERQKSANLIPSNETDDRALITPAKITICRDNGSRGKSISNEYILNGAESCKIKFNQTSTFTTSHSINTVTIKYGNQVTFAVGDGESVIIYFSLYDFIRLERLHN